MNAQPILRLGFLLGTFEGIERMHASAWAPGGPAASVVVGRSEMNGDIVVQSYEQRRNGAASFRMFIVWMIHPDTGEVLHYGFDSAGFPADPPARGSWSGDKLTLVRVTPRGHSRLVVNEEPDGWAWSKSFRVRPEDDWSPVFDARFRIPGTADEQGDGG